MREETPLDKYAELQPLVRKDIETAFQKVANDKQYEVAKVPAHTHNGSDSLSVLFSDLGDVQYHSQINTVTLTPAQVKTLNTIPVVLVPQPGARGVIIVDGVTVRLKYSGTAYTGTHNMEIHYTDGSGPQATDPISAAFLNSASSAFFHAPAVASSFAPIEGGTGTNGQIVAFVNTANPAAGNSQIIISIMYRLVSFRI